MVFVCRKLQQTTSIVTVVLGYKACDYKGVQYPSKDQYYLNADGRDDGLRDIAPESPEAFEAWYSSNARHGGHPWEVCRGGNSTCMYAATKMVGSFV